MHGITKQIIASLLIFSQALMGCNSLLLPRPDKQVINNSGQAAHEHPPAIAQAKILPPTFEPNYTLPETYQASFEEKEQRIPLVANKDDIKQPRYLCTGHHSNLTQTSKATNLTYSYSSSQSNNQHQKLSQHNTLSTPKKQQITQKHQALRQAKRGAFTNNPIEQTRQSAIEADATKKDQAIIATDSPLVFQTKGGYQVHFVHPKDQWAMVQATRSPLTRNLSLPVLHQAPHMNLRTLAKQNKIYQQYRMHVCLPEKDPKGIGYVYIGDQGLKGGAGGIHIDVEALINTMAMGYNFIGISPTPATINNWRPFLSELAHMLMGMEIDLSAPISNLDPSNMRPKFEGIVQRATERNIRLENYGVAYQHIINQIKKAIRQKQTIDIEPSAYPRNTYALSLQPNLLNMASLMNEINKLYRVQKGSNAGFDLSKVLHVADVVVTCNNSFLAFEKQEKERSAQEARKQKETPRSAIIQVSKEVSSLAVNKGLAMQDATKQVLREPQAMLQEQEKKQNGQKEEKRHIKRPEDYDLPGGMKIPHAIILENRQTVKITFGKSLIKIQEKPALQIAVQEPETYVSADRLVDRRLIPTLVQVLNTANKTVHFKSIHISATTNGHDASQVSNHRVENGARAIDISRIDGKYMESLGTHHPLVKVFQTALDEVPNIRENFGPYWLHKEKQIFSPKPIRKKQELIDMHRNHIHFSINK